MTLRLISPPRADGLALRADFESVGDFFRHRISVIAGDTETSVGWESVAPGDEPAWPRSPPIQELSLESVAGRDCLLGVGRAGKSHWSLSVETAADGELRFDFACRCSEPPRWLGSTYQPLSRSAAGLSAAVAPGAVAPGAVAQGAATQAPLSPMPPAFDGQLGTAIRPAVDGSLRIEPERLPDQWPGTVRWCYRVTVAN